MAEKKVCFSSIITIVAIIIGISLIVSAFSDAGGDSEIEGDIAYLDWNARINLSDEGALKAIVHTIGAEVYSLAKKNKNIKEVQVSLYYVDLEDKYGNDIPTEDALDSTFTIDNLDEVRKYKDGLAYALENESSLAYFVITGEYSYLWKN